VFDFAELCDEDLPILCWALTRSSLFKIIIGGGSARTKKSLQVNESIPPSVPRDAMHTRRVAVNGYRRHDDLYDIEGTLIDTKSQGFENIDRGLMKPVEPHPRDVDYIICVRSETLTCCRRRK